MNVYSGTHNNQKLETTQCPSVGECIHKMHTMEFYSVLKVNEVIHETTWMNLENIVFERNLSQKDTYYIYIYIYIYIIPEQANL